MSKYTENKNYIYYPSTNIPINKLNIREQTILEAEERKLLFKGTNIFIKTCLNQLYLMKSTSKIFIKRHLANCITSQVNIEQSIFQKDIPHFVR